MEVKISIFVKLIIIMERWIIYAIISMLFAGLTSVIAKFGMKDLSSDTALAIRTGVVFTIVIVNAFLFRSAYHELQAAPSKISSFLLYPV